MKRTIFLCFGLFLSQTLIAHEGHEQAGPAKKEDQERHVQITIKDDYRYIESIGMPNHPTGRFPNRGNPNTIRQQSYKYRVPLNPKMADAVTPLRMNPFGVAINGI